MLDSNQIPNLPPTFQWVPEMSRLHSNLLWGERDSNPQSSKGADLQSARLPVTGYLPMLNNPTTSSDSNRHTIIHASYGYGRHPRILTRVSYYTCVYQFRQTPKDCYLLKRCAITPNARTEFLSYLAYPNSCFI